jgi:hypothetical protein
VIFLTNVSNGSDNRSALLTTVGLRVPNRNFRDFKFFNVYLKRQNCPFLGCASAATAIDSDIDMFDGSSISTNDKLDFCITSINS